MPSTDHGVPPGDSLRRVGKHSAPLLAALLAVVLFALGWWSWHPLPIGVWHDDGAYVLVAESIANGDGLTWAGVAGTLPAAKFPPLFPTVAAAVLRWGPDPAQAAVALARLNMALMALAGAVFFLFLVDGIGLSVAVGGVGAALIWTAPSLWSLASVPLSEPLFMLGCATFLLLATKLEVRWTAGILAALLVAFAAAFYTRTVGIALIGGAVVAFASRGRWARSALLGGFGVLVAAPWVLWSRAANATIPDPLKDVLGSYQGWLSSEMIRSPGAYLRFAATNAWAVWTDLVGMMLPAASGWFLTTMAIALIPLALYGLLKLVKRSRTAALFLACYLTIVVFWPFQSPRLVTPALPLCLLAIGLSAQGLLRAMRTNRFGRLAVLSGFGVFAIAFAGTNARTLWRGDHLTQFDVRARALAAAAEAISTWVPEDGIVGAPELWAGVYIYTGRTVSPSARFLPLASDGPSWGTPDQQYELWKAAGIDHVLAEHGGGVHGAALDRMDLVCPGGAVELVATMPGALLTRLNWDRTCQEALTAAGVGDGVGGPR